MADYNIKARPTTYKGIQMRSRLEAKFAQWLDDGSLKGKWEYEPQCFADETGQYLPDFVIDGKTFIEVKPNRDHAVGALERMHIILGSVPTAELEVWIPIGQGESETFMPIGECLPTLHRHTDRNGRERLRGGNFGPCGCSRQRRPVDLRTAILSNSYGQHLHCMRCGEAYTHLMDVDTYKGSDNGRFTAKLHFLCEMCGEAFAIEVYNHKGYTVLNGCDAKDSIAWPGDDADDDAT